MADYYGTTDGFIAYHTLRGRTFQVVDLDDTEILPALLIASEWIDATYGTAFGGTKVGQRDQLREWPRNAAVDRNGYSIPASAVPAEVERATYEAALREVQKPGSLSVDWTPGKYKRASVDGAVSVEYASFSAAYEAQTQFLIVDQIIAPILTGGIGNASPLSGAINRI